MPKQGDNRQVVRAREDRAWQLRAEGLTQVQIAERMGLRQGAVSKLLSRVAQRTEEKRTEIIREERALVLDQHRHIYCQAMEAWRVSQKRKAKDGEDEVGEGNPRHLRVALEALAAIRKLLGLDAAQAHVVIPTSKLSPDEEAEIMRRMGFTPDPASVETPPALPAPVEAPIDLAAAVDAIAGTLPQGGAE